MHYVAHDVHVGGFRGRIRARTGMGGFQDVVGVGSGRTGSVGISSLQRGCGNALFARWRVVGASAGVVGMRSRLHIRIHFLLRLHRAHTQLPVVAVCDDETRPLNLEARICLPRPPPIPCPPLLVLALVLRPGPPDHRTPQRSDSLTAEIELLCFAAAAGADVDAHGVAAVIRVVRVGVLRGDSRRCRCG